ncbi:hypothetical protein AB0L57_15220 [Nocardia sp. NPDC052254]|uniref:hypothetical protein n=1 Tax=Nocardia sp. NPDC052254 TaxID=3155681 RepID=UPI003414C53C
MHRLEKSAFWRCVLSGLSALGAGFGAMVPVYYDCTQLVEEPEPVWDWSIPYEWFDHANG